METTINPFKNADYTADRDFLKFYHEQIAYYLSHHYKTSSAKMLKWVKHVFKVNQNGFNEVKFKVLEKTNTATVKSKSKVRENSSRV